MNLYLRFGVVFGDSEAELNRTLAQSYSEHDLKSYVLNTYSQPDTVVVNAGETRYAALIVYMPEEVGNKANYQGSVVPLVDLGITMYAQQTGTEMS